MQTIINQMVQDDHWNKILHYSIFVRKFDWATISLLLQIVKKWKEKTFFDDDSGPCNMRVIAVINRPV